MTDIAHPLLKYYKDEIVRPCIAQLGRSLVFKGTTDNKEIVTARIDLRCDTRRPAVNVALNEEYTLRELHEEFGLISIEITFIATTPSQP